MGNRTGGPRVYSVPTFFTLREVRSIYSKANPELRQKMNAIVPIKLNFNVFRSGKISEILVNPDQNIVTNTSTNLSIILNAVCHFDDIAVLQFQFHDQKIFI
jgi:hypothetical protein